MITRKCVHLITGSYFWSRNKDGGHVIWSVIAENTTLHAHFIALCVINAELLAWKCSHGGDPVFCWHTGIRCENTGWKSTFLLFLPWPWPDDLHIRQTWSVLPGDTRNVQIWTSYVKDFESSRLTDRLTTPLHGWSVISLIYTFSRRKSVTPEAAMIRNCTRQR